MWTQAHTDLTVQEANVAGVQEIKKTIKLVTPAVITNKTCVNKTCIMVLALKAVCSGGRARPKKGAADELRGSG